MLRKLFRLFANPVMVAYALAGGVALCSFVSTFILARLTGPEVIGDYALAMSTAGLLTTFAVLGLDRIVIREVAGDLRQENSARARRVLRLFALTVAAVAVATAAIYGGALAFTPLIRRLGGGPAMTIAIVSVLVWPLQRMAYSGLRGAGAPVLGQLYEAMPTYLFMAGILAIFVLGIVPTAADAVGIAVVSQLLAAVAAWWILAGRTRRWGNAGAKEIRYRLLVAGLPVMGSLFLQHFSDWLLLARISSTMGAAETGAFRVAVQIISIITTLVATTESYVAAEIAAEFRSGRPDRAWRVHRKATFLMLALTAPAFLILWTIPGLLLGTVFGPGFAIAGTATAILAIGQLANVLRGPLGAMFVMSGNQHIDLLLTLGSLALVVLLALLFIPRFGLEGAAIAQISALCFRAIVGYVVARRLIPAQSAS